MVNSRDVANDCAKNTIKGQSVQWENTPMATSPFDDGCTSLKEIVDSFDNGN